MSLELILLQGLNIKNEGIIEAIDTCEHALYSLPFDPDSMRIIPYVSPLTPWTNRDDPLHPLNSFNKQNPFVTNYEEHKNMMQEAMKNPYGYEPVSYPALSEPIIPKPIIPETITPMSAISTPSFMKPITTSIFESKGLMDFQPYQAIYDLPGTKTQLHLHGPDPNIITHAHIVDYNHKSIYDLTGYDASMASLYADKFNFKKIIK